MKFVGESLQHVTITATRSESKALVRELEEIFENHSPPMHSYPNVLHVVQQLGEAERKFQADEYQGPG